ncbi:MAG TPA: NADH-quinone oxidoreductase subunit H [Alphaproteobacteria bacterium]|nr:NADH-quinone oxidoreductase subunit H [Alphaproteobacteria bacterium]
MTGALLTLLQLALTLAAAPLVTGIVRWVKARLNGRRGPGPLQPYRDLLKLLRKETVVAENASWLFRAVPYLVFALTWLAAAIVPSFATGLALGGSADLIALVAILGSARFLLALAGMDVGTAFGGLGSSREMMIASLAEPAMLTVTFTMALLVRSTSLPHIAEFLLSHDVGIRVSLGLALISLMMVALAENGRIPVDNPATHLELTMVHEAMVLEYSGRHLALIEAAQMLKLVTYLSLIACLFAPWGLDVGAVPGHALALGLESWLGKLLVGALALALFETGMAKMRVFRVAEFLGGSLLLGLLAAVFLYVSQGL